MTPEKMKIVELGEFIKQNAGFMVKNAGDGYRTEIYQKMAFLIGLLVLYCDKLLERLEKLEKRL